MRFISRIIAACSVISLYCQAQNESSSADEFVSLSVLLDNVNLPPAENVSRVKEQQLQQYMDKNFPHVSSDDLVHFYQKNNPDALKAFLEENERDDKTAQAYLEVLVGHFVRLQDMKNENPREYLRLLEIEQYESLSRRLSQKIRSLKAAQKSGSLTAEAKKELSQAEVALHKILKKIFDAVQENQLIEINRLEAEMRELRRLLEERAVNQDAILRNRYEKLAGQRQDNAAIEQSR